MRIKIVGQRVLVKPDPIEEKTSSGLLIARPQDVERAERAATEKGVVVQVSSIAFQDIGDGTPWCAEGDYIIYAKHSGKDIKDPDTGERYYMIRDEDVQGVIEPKKD